VKVVILAGGSATRMQPYSYYTEKSLLPLAGGKPIIRIIVDRLINTFGPYTHQTIICILGKYRPNFEWEFRDMLHDIPIGFSEKVEAIGTATHYYFAAEKEFNFSPDETVLIHYADALTELDYAHFLKEFEETGRESMIAVTKNAKHDYSEVGLGTEILPDGSSIMRVDAFHEKPKLESPTWTGIMLLKHRVMQEEFGTPLFGKKSDFAYDIFPKLVEKKKLYAYLYDGIWEDVGNLHSYSKAVEKYRGGSLFV
jgi:NDP-sugar pyrophosphorylase family protein